MDGSAPPTHFLCEEWGDAPFWEKLRHGGHLEQCGRKARALREPCAKYKSRCGCSRFRCLFSSFGEEHELVARKHSKKNEQKTSEP